MALSLKSHLQFTKKDLLVIVIAALIQFTTSFIGSMLQVAIPLISNDLHLTIELANWITISYLIALIAVSVPISRVISQYGVKRFTIYGVLILEVGLAMSALSFDIVFLIFSRIIIVTKAYGLKQALRFLKEVKKYKGQLFYGFSAKLGIK